jgi:hypothetical protein
MNKLSAELSKQALASKVISKVLAPYRQHMIQGYKIAKDQGLDAYKSFIQNNIKPTQVSFHPKTNEFRSLEADVFGVPTKYTHGTAGYTELHRLDNGAAVQELGNPDQNYKLIYFNIYDPNIKAELKFPFAFDAMQTREGRKFGDAPQRGDIPSQINRSMKNVYNRFSPFSSMLTRYVDYLR